MSWLQLDDNMPDHPKVAALTDTAFRHHIEGLSYCARLLTDGFIPAKVAADITTPKTLLELESEQLPGRAALWERAAGGWAIHDYLEYNLSRVQVLDRREKKSRAGKAGADSRYGTSDSKRNGSRDSKRDGTRTRSGKDTVHAPTLPTPLTATVLDGDAPTHPPHGGGKHEEQTPTLPPQLERILANHIVRELKPSQIQLVAEAWNTSTELRHSLADIEAAENPVAMLISVAKRIIPADDQSPAQRTAAANSKRAAAIAACRRMWQAGIDQGDNPDALRDSIDREYRHDPTIVTEALAIITSSDADVPL